MSETAPLVSVEPEETEDPRNALLDMIEAVVDAHDLAAPLFARLERMKPPREPIAPPSAPVAPAAGYSIERELRASKAMIGLQELEHAIRSPARKALIKPIREIIEQEAAGLRAARTGEHGE